MSNVLYFQQALSARNARISSRADYAADPLGGFGHAGMGAADDLVYRVQTDLNRLAGSTRNTYFNAGTADGIWGANTQSAVRNFRASAGLNPDPGSTPAAYMDAAFLGALAKAVAGLPAGGLTRPPAPTGTAPAPPQPPPGTLAKLPTLEAAKQWLLAPGKPVYQKPILWVGAGVVLLTIVLAMRSRD